MYYWALKKAVCEVQVYFLSSGARHVAILGLALTKLLCMYGYPLCKEELDPALCGLLSTVSSPLPGATSSHVNEAGAHSVWSHT